MKVGLTPRQILDLPTMSLKKRFKDTGYPITTDCAKKIKGYRGKMLLPEDKVLNPEIELLRREVKLLETLEAEIAEVEDEMVKGGKGNSMESSSWEDKRHWRYNRV